MRRHVSQAPRFLCVLRALPALAAATALTVSGCSSGGSKPAASGSTAPATPGASPSVEAICLLDTPGEKQVTHFKGGNDHLVEAYTTGDGRVGVIRRTRWAPTCASGLGSGPTSRPRSTR